MHKSLIKTALLLIFFSLSAFAQSYLITNDDPFRRPNSVSTYSIQADGSLLRIGQFPTGGNGGANSGDPSGQGIGFIPTTRIVVTPDNQFVFVTNAPDNTISGFSIHASTGILTPVPGSPFATGGNACQGMGLAASPSAPFLYALNTCSQDVTSFRIAGNGALTVVGAAASTGAEGEDLRVTGDGKFLGVSLSGFQRGVAMFRIAADGTLTTVPGSPFIGSAGFPGALEANCAGDQFFLLNDGSPSSVDVFSVAPDGSLSLAPQSSFTIPLPPGAGGEVGMYLSPDQKRLFVSDVFSFASSYQVAADGTLTPVSSFVPSNNTIFLGHLATDPAGKFLYGAGLLGNVGAYSIDGSGAITPFAASPFSTPGFTAIGSFAAYPSRGCSFTVGLQIRRHDESEQGDGGNDDPGNPVVTIDADGGGKLQVAILSAAGFDAFAQVDTASLTFGHSGSENSLVACRREPRDVNGDTLADLVCSFRIREAGFAVGDTQAILHGRTIGGTPIVGTAPVNVVP